MKILRFGVALAVLFAVHSPVAHGAEAPPAAPAILSLSLSPGRVAGASDVTGTVTLMSPAPAGGAVVSLTASGAGVSVPETMRIDEGSTEGTFHFATRDPGTATITATTAAANGPSSVSGQVFVLAVLGRLIAPTTARASGEITITVALNGRATEDTVISFDSSDETLLDLPHVITVPTGSIEATFAAKTGRRLPGNRQVVITAAQGAVKKQATVTIQ